jgi:hypothetical protein
MTSLTTGMSPPDDTVGGELKGPIRDPGVTRAGLQLTIQVNCQGGVNFSQPAIIV